eukprot:SAG31_NODE_9973_length_1202_cov_1.435177_1_plen_160_part_10
MVSGDARIPNRTCFLVASPSGSFKHAGRTLGRIEGERDTRTGTRLLSWQPDWMLPGAVIDVDGAVGRSDGPLIVFDAGTTVGNRTGATLALSALDHFSANAPQFWSDELTNFSMWMSLEAALYPMQNKTLTDKVLQPPSGTVLRSVLLARGELKRAILAW